MFDFLLINFWIELNMSRLWKFKKCVIINSISINPMPFAINVIKQTDP